VKASTKSRWAVGRAACRRSESRAPSMRRVRRSRRRMRLSASRHCFPIEPPSSEVFAEFPSSPEGRRSPKTTISRRASRGSFAIRAATTYSGSAHRSMESQAISNASRCASNERGSMSAHRERTQPANVWGSTVGAPELREALARPVPSIGPHDSRRRRADGPGWRERGGPGRGLERCR